MTMTITVAIIMIFTLGLVFRLRYLRLPLDWDHGLLLYQSFWYRKLGKFIAGWHDYYPEAPSCQNDLGVTPELEEKIMLRYQSLGFSFMNIINYLICRDKVWAYRVLDIFYSLLISGAIFLWGSQIFCPRSAALGAAFFFLCYSLPLYWGAMDNPEKFQILFTTCGFLCISLSIKTPGYFFCVAAATSSSYPCSSNRM